MEMGERKQEGQGARASGWSSTAARPAWNKPLDSAPASGLQAGGAAQHRRLRCPAGPALPGAREGGVAALRCSSWRASITAPQAGRGEEGSLGRGAGWPHLGMHQLNYKTGFRVTPNPSKLKPVLFSLTQMLPSSSQMRLYFSLYSEMRVGLGREGNSIEHLQ